MLEDLAVWADAAQNPATMREKIAAKHGINLDGQDGLEVVLLGLPGTSGEAIMSTRAQDSRVPCPLLA